MILTEEGRAALTRFSDVAVGCAEAGTLRNLVFSSPDGGDVLKIKGTLRLIGGNRVVQLEKSCTEGRVAQENVFLTALPAAIERYFCDAFSRVDLNDESGSASLMRSKKEKVTAVIPGALKNALRGAAVRAVNAAMDALGNDREKQRVLNGSEPFLIALGISDAAGRVHDKKQAKFRQIARFSELVLEALPHLPPHGTLHVADLCCGKSYLSFAVYHVLTVLCGREADMLCMDLKKSVIDFCADTARRLHYDGMHFLCGDINTYVPDKPPHLVLSLHACDTATDIVLDAAMRWRADAILSTPCCQRELSRRLSCAPLAFLGDRPALRRKFCDAATDALRLSRLECMGYRADALEFIDPEDTPKNIMLRAYRAAHFSPDSPAIRKKRADYAAAYRFLTEADPPPFPETEAIQSI